MSTPGSLPGTTEHVTANRPFGRSGIRQNSDQRCDCRNSGEFRCESRRFGSGIVPCW